MKNPLADALRQSSGTERQPVDSGQFNTLDVSAVATANDEQVSSDDAIDLQLLETTGALVLDNGTVRVEGQEESADSNSLPTPDTSLIVDTRLVDSERPALARMAPLVCLAAIASTIGVWLLHHYLQSSAIGSVPETTGYSSANTLDTVNGTVQIPGAERFPFIDSKAVVEPEETE